MLNLKLLGSSGVLSDAFKEFVAADTHQIQHLVSHLVEQIMRCFQSNNSQLAKLMLPLVHLILKTRWTLH